MSKKQNSQPVKNTSTTKNKQGQQKKSQSQTQSEKKAYQNSFEELLDFYRKAGYDYARVSLTTGEQFTIVLNDMLLLRAGITVRSEVGNCSVLRVRSSYADIPLEMSLNNKMFRAVNPNNLSADHFVADLNHVVQAANQTLRKEKELLNNTSSSVKFLNISDLLNFMTVQLERYNSDSPLDVNYSPFIYVPKTNLIFTNKQFAVLQQYENFTGLTWNDSCIYRPCVGSIYYGNIQKTTPETDVAINLISITKCTPHKSTFNIKDTTVRTWFEKVQQESKNDK